ncbi:helix-turn-helix transcriptional regulator [Nitrospirillum bahiense]|uniref:DNA-binding XRE family transcriptional regulator n=1 Tax=Nitrospirillum amazonense TaxID=28077 RepID=A0A560G7D4_9PROT|nr:transcriptional regulator [Nitrospirillum amazonense]TWB29660.1 DNA-binding XRE family transcriptional regulator [Nitrospirillum amazonense]
MSTPAGGISPLDWPGLVAEAVRRRKAEKMTQKEHAALAGVSIPTMIAFDRGEATLSLNKALDILRVVGLVAEAPTPASSQEAFVQAAFSRWRELTKDLPKDSPARFPAGWYRIDYALEGDHPAITPAKLRDALEQSVLRYTGWPLFLFMRRPELAPYEIDGEIECWLPPDDHLGIERNASDPAHCDFWRAASPGRLMSIRGYQEDAQDTFPAGSIFDTTLPIWRLGEAYMHAAKLTEVLGYDPQQTTVRLRVLYTGLSGREVRAWANPMSVDYFGGGRSRTDEAMLEGAATVQDLEDDLAGNLYPLISSLYERFGITGLSLDFVKSETQRMRLNRFHR